MRKFGVVALILAISVVFTGCTNNEVKLYNAIMKSQDITSMESDTNISLNLEGEGFSKEDQQGLQEVANMLKDSKISIHQKMVQNEEKTSARAQVKTGLNFAGMDMDMKVWVDTDMSGDTPKMVEIIKMPKTLMTQMSPEDSEKAYIVYNFEDMVNSGQEVNFKELMNFSKEMQPKMINFMKDYHKNFDPGFEIASYKGKRDIDEKTLSIYEVKLDDASFKELIRYMVNSSMDNENTIKFIEEYMNAVMGLVQIPDSEKESAKEEMSQEIGKLQNNLPELKKQFNEFMDNFKDVKILGDKGIVIEYGVNSDGYIAHQSGKIDMNIDLKAIGKAIGNDTLVKNSGVLRLGINYNTKNYNINKDMRINMPSVNKRNAMYYKDILEQEQAGNMTNKGIEEKPIESNK